MDMDYTQSFDYIVIGAGIGGLVVASRLAEDESKSVVVLEAGGHVSNQPGVQIPGLYSQNIAKPDLDWGFTTVPQDSVDGRSIYIPRGKGVGGSSILNFLSAGRASKEEYNAFESLGSQGWNWNELAKYFVKSETFLPTPGELEKYGIQPDPEFHGTNGPLQRSLAVWDGGNMFNTFYEALHTLGIPRNFDNCSGSTVGTCVSTNTIDPKTVTRSSAATAYYEANRHKPNLQVLTNAHVSRILFKQTSEGAVAEAVEFIRGKVTHKLLANVEVIVAAGSIQTPQILELSGIGDKEILSSHGIPVVVDLPGVGTNLQEHVSTMFVAEMDPKYDSLDRLTDPAQAAAEMKLYEDQKQGVFAATVSVAFSFLPLKQFADAEAFARKAAASGESGPGSKAVRKQHEEWLTSDTVPQLEFVQVSAPFPIKGFVPKEGKKYFSLFMALLHPLSVGSVHISSTDPLANPDIDLNLLRNSVDLDTLVAAIKFARKVIATDTLKPIVHAEVAPGPTVQTDDAIKSYVKANLSTVFHPVGSASMLPRDDGGVVDDKLGVYGTVNLRVVDASIIPIQLAAHTQLTVYAIAEKAADIIKESQA